MWSYISTRTTYYNEIHGYSVCPDCYELYYEIHEFCKQRKYGGNYGKIKDGKLTCYNCMVELGLEFDKDVFDTDDPHVPDCGCELHLNSCN